MSDNLLVWQQLVIIRVSLHVFLLPVAQVRAQPAGEEKFCMGCCAQWENVEMNISNHLLHKMFVASHFLELIIWHLY